MFEFEPDWDNPAYSIGRLPFRLPDAAEVSGIVELARSALANTAPETQGDFLLELGDVLAGFAESIAWGRAPISFGAVCTRFQWWPIAGGSAPVRTDIHVLAD